MSLLDSIMVYLITLIFCIFCCVYTAKVLKIQFCSYTQIIAFAQSRSWVLWGGRRGDSAQSQCPLCIFLGLALASYHLMLVFFSIKNCFWGTERCSDD